MTKHAVLSPSGAYRWVNCPGSIPLGKGIPRKSSVYAAEGTAAHALAERCLLSRAQAADFLGAVIETDDGNFEVTPAMAAAVQQYLDTCHAQLAKLPLARMEVEVRVDLERYVPGLFGTCDCLIIEEFGRIVVIDYKHGAGVVVSPYWNFQMMIYGLGAALKYDCTQVTMIIVQPNAPAEYTGAPNWQEFTLTTEELCEWAENVLVPAAALTETDNAPLAAGDHCKFCPVKPNCPELRRLALETAQVQFDDAVVPVEKVPTLPLPGALTNDQLGRVVQVLGVVAPWFDACKDELHQRLDDGSATPEDCGYKLVQGRATRAWKDEAEAERVLNAKLKDDAYVTKLLSPAQAEKALKAAGRPYSEIEDFVAVTKGVSMVPVSDKRPALTPAQDLFEITEQF